MSKNNINDKIAMIYSWLENGYTVKKIGAVYSGGYSDYIYKRSIYYNYCSFGSSAVKANISNLKWLLANIFDIENDDFYIISDGLMICTNSEYQAICNLCICDFDIWDRDDARDNYTNTNKFMTYSCTRTKFLINYEKYIHEHEKITGENHIRIRANIRNLNSYSLSNSNILSCFNVAI